MPVVLEVGEAPQVSSGWVLGQIESGADTSENFHVDVLLEAPEANLSDAFMAHGIIGFFNLCEKIIKLIMVHPPGTFREE